MDIAVTLIIQGVAFFVVVLVVMKFLWPPFIAIIEERNKKIAEGLAAGSRAQNPIRGAIFPPQVLDDGLENADIVVHS